MSLKEVTQWLLSNNYAHIINNNCFVLDKKFHDELGFVNNTPVEVVVPINLSPINLSDPKEVWNKFIEDANIPWRVKNNLGQSYTIRQYSKSMANKLVSIVNNSQIDYQRLVDSTKHYYATTSYKLLLSNYLEKGVWKDCYDNYKQTTSTNEVRTDGSNRWES